MSYNTYIGKRGYCIYKNNLSVKEQEYIRKELTVKPFIPNSSPFQNVQSYSIYKESIKKFYLPRYFGINTFGQPNEIKINKGLDINIKFNGTLKERQYFIANKFLNHINNNNYGGLLDLYTGAGKTVLALYLLSKIKKKTLIIVHKGFLLDQWIERISQFLPNAKIGKIQGQTIDIENKDIVIGMLQSLSMKEYPEDMFSDFGLMIVDEVHHIAAEVFCQALQNISTYYHIGLSATMERKDGLTKVFKMYLGDVIHKEKSNSQDHNILIKAVKFKSNDEEFNQCEYDTRGNIKYTTMISKLCSFNKRSEFILDIVINELNNNNDQQIMILSQFKELLVYLFKAFNHKNINDIGYYVGGMKKVDLKNSESKKIILATYGMASEGLDIKSLTTLVLATPISDVEQSVGRIIRIKHDNPLVIDIIDKHDIFNKQWNKRKQFYNKKNYKIIMYEDYKKNEWREILKRGKNEELKVEEFNFGKCMIDF